MTCPRCGLSVRLRAPYLTLERCPRCIAKRGVSMPMVISGDRRDPTGGTFRIETSWSRDGLILTLHGELDIASSPILERRLLDAQACGAQRIVVDLSGLEFMDSAGLHVLLDAHRRRVHPRLVLRRGRPSIQRLFELASADSMFHFETGSPAPALTDACGTRESVAAPPGVGRRR